MLLVADPNIALLLFVLGVLGIYAEFSRPGMIVPGVVGSVLAILALRAFSVLTFDWRGVVLVLLAFSLFIVEARFQTHGILTAAGAIALLAGTMLALPVRLSAASTMTIPFALVTSFLLSVAVRARRNKEE